MTKDTVEVSSSEEVTNSLYTNPIMGVSTKGAPTSEASLVVKMDAAVITEEINMDHAGADDSPAKRGRGRPRGSVKTKVTPNTIRGRGRGRGGGRGRGRGTLNSDDISQVVGNVANESENSPVVVVKKGRGRPSKKSALHQDVNGEISEVDEQPLLEAAKSLALPKRGRGRPPKKALEEDQVVDRDPLLEDFEAADESSSTSEMVTDNLILEDDVLNSGGKKMALRAIRVLGESASSGSSTPTAVSPNGSRTNSPRGRPGTRRPRGRPRVHTNISDRGLDQKIAANKPVVVNGVTPSKKTAKNGEVKTTPKPMKVYIYNSWTLFQSCSSLKIISLSSFKKVKSRWRKSVEEEDDADQNALVQQLAQQIKIGDANGDYKSLEGSPLMSPRVNLTNYVVDINSLDETKAEISKRLESFEHIRENHFMCARRSNKQSQGMECDCTISKEDYDQGIKGCGDDCLNRLLMIECTKTCSLGNLCSNKRFQNVDNAPTEVFKTADKGVGIRATADTPA
jgi:hypothetical protein